MVPAAPGQEGKVAMLAPLLSHAQSPFKNAAPERVYVGTRASRATFTSKLAYVHQWTSQFKTSICASLLVQAVWQRVLACIAL